MLLLLPIPNRVAINSSWRYAPHRQKRLIPDVRVLTSVIVTAVGQSKAPEVAQRKAKESRHATLGVGFRKTPESALSVGARRHECVNICVPIFAKSSTESKKKMHACIIRFQFVLLCDERIFTILF